MSHKKFRSLILVLAIAIALTALIYSIPDRRTGQYKKYKIRAYFDNGTVKDLVVKCPSYAGLSISQSRGAHRLSTWEYIGFKGFLRGEKVILYGVQYFEYQ